jgi:hypothetical protein
MTTSARDHENFVPARATSSAAVSHRLGSQTGPATCMNSPGPASAGGNNPLSGSAAEHDYTVLHSAGPKQLLWPAAGGIVPAFQSVYEAEVLQPRFTSPFCKSRAGCTMFATSLGPCSTAQGGRVLRVTQTYLRIARGPAWPAPCGRTAIRTSPSGAGALEMRPGHGHAYK